MNRKRPCMASEEMSIEYEQYEKNNVRCKYCFQNMRNERNRSTHESRCKMADDHVRQLELRLKIHVELPDSDSQCRFCSRDFSRKDNLRQHYPSCKAKRHYAIDLERMMDNALAGVGTTHEQSGQTNNINNGTIVININEPRPFGQENLEYITKKYIKTLWERCNRLPDEFASLLLAKIHGDENHPENMNVLYTNLRSGHARVFNGKDYELRLINDVIKEASSNSLDHITAEHYDPSDFEVKEIIDECEDSQGKKELFRKARLALYNVCPKRTDVADHLKRLSV